MHICAYTPCKGEEWRKKEKTNRRQKSKMRESKMRINRETNSCFFFFFFFLCDSRFFRCENGHWGKKKESVYLALTLFHISGILHMCWNVLFYSRQTHRMSERREKEQDEETKRKKKKKNWKQTKKSVRSERTIVPILNYAYKILFRFFFSVLSKFMRTSNFFDTPENKCMWATSREKKKIGYLFFHIVISSLIVFIVVASL